MYPINISQIDYQSPAINSEKVISDMCAQKWHVTTEQLTSKGKGEGMRLGSLRVSVYFTSHTAWYFTLLFCPIGICHPEYPIRIQRLALVI